MSTPSTTVASFGWGVDSRKSRTLAKVVKLAQLKKLLVDLDSAVKVEPRSQMGLGLYWYEQRVGGTNRARQLYSQEV